jgi:hypothetical protein
MSPGVQLWPGVKLRLQARRHFHACLALWVLARGTLALVPVLLWLVCQRGPCATAVLEAVLLP